MKFKKKKKHKEMNKVKEAEWCGAVEGVQQFSEKVQLSINILKPV